MSDQDKKDDDKKQEDEKLSSVQKEVVERTASDVKTFQRPGVEKRG